MVKLSFRNLPIGDLPYETNEAATKMMVKLFENIPYLAMLPRVSEKENLYHHTLGNVSGVNVKDKKCILVDDGKTFKQALVRLDVAYNNPSVENVEPYYIDSVFFPKYLQILKRIKPKETVFNLLGPFSVAQLLSRKDGPIVLTDKCYRKFVIQTVFVKAAWAIYKIKEASPETIPVVILEEPLYYQYGDIKRENQDLTRDVVLNMFTKVIKKIQDLGAVVAVQSFEKCDWQIPIEAGVDIISFDAYNNPNNLNIIAEKVNDFLAAGGRINWAIVPVKNEAMVKSLTVDFLYEKLEKTLEGFIVSGVSERLAYNRALVSVQGDVDHLPLIFAEKALILSTQLAKRIPIKS